MEILNIEILFCFRLDWSKFFCVTIAIEANKMGHISHVDLFYVLVSH